MWIPLDFSTNLAQGSGLPPNSLNKSETPEARTTTAVSHSHNPNSSVLLEIDELIGEPSQEKPSMSASISRPAGGGSGNQTNSAVDLLFERNLETVADRPVPVTSRLVFPSRGRMENNINASHEIVA